MRKPKKPSPREHRFFHVSQILAWADAWHEERGQWPHVKSGRIPGTLGLRWVSVESALRNGSWGLPPGSSLARLLHDQRGVRNPKRLPDYSPEQILAWADDHLRRQGSWPRRDSGAIAAARGETWMAVEMALHQGGRGLPGGDTLPQLLARERGVRNPRGLSRLSLTQILRWADDYFQRTGTWPIRASGRIADSDNETWGTIDAALHRGSRGLGEGGSSLARLLEERRGVRNHAHLPPLDLAQILAWADEHCARTGAWPRTKSGVIPGSGGETWCAVDSALMNGLRGLSGGSSLARVLYRFRQAPYTKLPMNVEQILAWADEHKRRTGDWPWVSSGPIAGAPGRTWAGVDVSLRAGQAGLPGGSSLARLLADHRGKRNSKNLPPYTEAEILAWARSYRRRTGKWPAVKSGPIPEAPGETWAKVEKALYKGCRGFPGGSSLYRFLRASSQIGP